jgi:adenylate kinase
MFHRPVKDGLSACVRRKLLQRPDDNEAAVRARLVEYHEKTRPIVDLFRQKELVIVADGTRTPEDVHRDIRSQLKLQSPA